MAQTGRSQVGSGLFCPVGGPPGRARSLPRPTGPSRDLYICIGLSALYIIILETYTFSELS
jgi:hypothetical protein